MRLSALVKGTMVMTHNSLQVGIRPATLRLASLIINQCATPSPLSSLPLTIQNGINCLVKDPAHAKLCGPFSPSCPPSPQAA